MRILLVEESLGLLKFLRKVLERERFIVDHADAVKAAREASMLGSSIWSCSTGLCPMVKACRWFLPCGLTTPDPRIVLSARNGVDDRVAGLDRGADDYLTKPFSIDEMLARIRAVRRAVLWNWSARQSVPDRSYSTSPTRKWRWAARGSTSRDGNCGFSRALIKRRGRTVQREALENAVFGFDDECNYPTH